MHEINVHAIFFLFVLPAKKNAVNTFAIAITTTQIMFALSGSMFNLIKYVTKTTERANCSAKVMQLNNLIFFKGKHSFPSTVISNGVSKSLKHQ